MKKAIAILSIVVLASCGGGKTTETSTTDSTSVHCDTTTCIKDSTTTDATKVVVDSTK